MLTTLDKAVGTCLRTLLGVCASLLLLAQPSVHLVGEAHATAQTSTIWPSFRTGTVYTRNFVRGPNGERIFAEFGADGRVVREIGEAVGDYANAVAMSGDAYRNAVQAYDRVLDELGETDAQGAYILSREAYDRTNFTTLSGTPVTNKPGLYGSTKSVLVRNARKLLTPGTSPLLLESTIDLQNRQELQERIKSVLLTPGGQVLVSSEHNIGYRSAFVKPTGGDPGECSPAYGPEEDSRKYRNVSKDDVCGPVGGALITAQVLPGREGGTLSDPAGHYSLSYLLYPCPGFDIEYTNYFIPKFYYTAFNPKGERRPGMYYQVTQVYDWCFGSHELLKHSGNLAGLSAYLNAEAILSTLAEPSKRLDIGIDVMAVTGVGRLGNTEAEADAIPLGQTRYTTDLPTFTPGNPEGLDLDGDRTDDTILDLQGLNIVDASGAAVTVEPNSVAVYLGDKQPEYDDTGNLRNTYDLIRKKDTAPDTEHQGLLSELSTEDLEATDLYVYRTSNDQLIFERKGLDPNEDGYQRGQGGGAVEGSEAAFYYYSVLRGPYGNNTYFQKDFETWQADSGMNPDLYAREADHLRIGETIKLIAVNRKTGYIGTATAQVGNAAQNGSGRIDFPIPDIVMRPPNLKIKAERSYNIQAGLTKDEEREYLIGFEGSGLASDRIISISTEWLDHDGTPLPADLPGYTARLAKIVGDQTLGDNLAEFELKTGTHLQLIRLPDDAVLSNDHFYVHVAGSPPEDSPNFSSTGAGDGVLASRPRHYVPILVPVFDEVETRARRNQQRYAREDGTLNDDEPRAEGVYTWVYRPEMQFSVLDLTVQALNRTDSEGNTVDVYPAGSDANPDTIPGFASSDQYAQLLYTLLMGGYAPLDSLGYTDPNRTTLDPENTTGREYLFAFGEEEMYATFGEDQVARFDHLDSLAALQPEDYFSLRLIQNTDSENVLWEFAFEYLGLDTRLVGHEYQTDEVFYVTADDPVVPLQAILYGYANRDPEDKQPKTVRWLVEGDGSIQPASQTDHDLGVFDADLTLPTTKGASATPRALLQSADTPIRAAFKRVEVLAGKPASIAFAATGQAVAMGADTLTVTVTVRDQHFNHVEDGTPIRFNVSESAQITEYAGITANGQAVVKITGGGFAATDAQLAVKVGDVEATHTFDVAPLTVTLSTGDSSPQTKSTQPVLVTVTTPSGEPVGDKVVTLSSTVGQFQQPEIVTGADGVAHAVFHTGFATGPGMLQARVGYAGGTEENITVQEAGGGAIAVDTRDVFVVGDAATPGSVSYTRYDGTSISMPYQVSGTLTLQGADASQHTVTLGDLADPNLEPLMAFYMNDLEPRANFGFDAPDETGLHTGEATNIEVVFDNPNGAGKSYRFNGNGHIRVADDARLNMTSAIGFRVDIKPTGANGTLFSHAGGVHHLSLVNGRVVYRLQTDAGSIQVQSDPLALDQWHTIAGRFAFGQLVLEVDGVQFATAATGQIQYGASQPLMIASGYDGLMDSFRWYDWNAPALLRLPNGTGNESVTLDATGNAALTVASTGQLGSLQAGSTLRSLRIAAQVGGQRRFVSVISSGAFTTLGQDFMDNYATFAPPINTAALQISPYATVAYGDTSPLDFFIAPAHAWDWNWSGGSAVWDAVKSGVGLLVPYEDFAMLARQLYYLATQDWENFDASELAFSALGSATIIPIMKPLKPILNPLKTFIKRYGNRPIVKAFAGVVGPAVEEALRGRTEKLLSILPYLLIVAELAADPDGLNTINLLVDTVTSPDDLWAWIDYFNLPEDGWEGDQLPELELVMAPPTGTLGMFAKISPLDWVIPPAHAAGGKGKRLGIDKLKRVTQGLRRLDANLLEGQGAKVIEAIKGVTSSMKLPEVGRQLRRLAHDPRMIGAAAAAGGQALRNIVKKGRNLRMSPLAIVATITYLETRRGGCNEVPAPCRALLPEVARKIPTLYGIAFLEVLTGEKEFVFASRENGALFHLAMIAVKHLEYEVSGNPADQIIRIEQDRPIQLYAKAPGGGIRQFGQSLKRRIDIVLAGEGGVATTPTAENIWIEVKSLKQQPNYKGWEQWNMGAKGTTYHRQYFLDRVASTTNPLPNWVTTDRVATDYHWWLQDFKRKTIRSYNPTELKQLHDRVRILPKPTSSGSAESYSSVGETSASHKQPIAAVQARFKLFNLKTWLTGEARQYLLDGIEESLIEELVTNSDEF